MKILFYQQHFFLCIHYHEIFLLITQVIFQFTKIFQIELTVHLPKVFLLIDALKYLFTTCQDFAVGIHKKINKESCENFNF